MTDVIIARIRTWWPLFLGHVAALIALWIAAQFGYHINDVVITEGLGLAASAAVWELGRVLEARGGTAAKVGGWLLALGAQVGLPSYQSSGSVSTASPAAPAASTPGPTA